MELDNTELKIILGYIRLSLACYNRARKDCEIDNLKKSLMWEFMESIYHLLTSRKIIEMHFVSSYGFNNTYSDNMQYYDHLYFKALKKQRKHYLYGRGKHVEQN